MSHQCEHSVTCYFAWTSCDGVQTGNHMCGRTRKLRAFPSTLNCLAGSLPDIHYRLTAAAANLMSRWHTSKKFKNQFPNSGCFLMAWIFFLINIQLWFTALYFCMYISPRKFSIALPSFNIILPNLLLHDFVSTSRDFVLRGANRSNVSLKGPQQHVITSPMNLCAPVALRRGLGREKRTALSLETSVRHCAVRCMASHNPLQLHYLAKKLPGHDVATQQRDTFLRNLQRRSPGPQTVIDPFIFQEQFHSKCD